ncbi:3-beta hydroxysteroid dehydrogenase [Skermanella stibiiresistens SB22]|uniref:3-beta hydroxysteroid dehydrogenase n=1 Tax=Skermanella stibiiresistens SB22 TaxID=1385369 RepID=W9H3Y0_9PROT|nr:SDR family oxidoreductase [Skermanella stibiiresistens]EWY40754.1 3-beta hydroxysteroid dehydrogenase [Skermanella stibiiresistens SB22]
MTPIDLAGRTVLITGASRGIGFGVAEAFAKTGAVLHIAAENEGIHQAAADLGATAHQVDVTRGDQVEAMAAAIGAVDVLINNAGLELMTPLDDTGPENEAAFRRIIEINILGTFLVTRAVTPRMPPGSAIINTASSWGRVAEPLFSAYVASKHAVIGLTKTWAKELGPSGIRVNSVCPGWVRTEASMRSLGRMAERVGRPERELLDGIIAGQALPGLMEPSDMAGPYLFLASGLAANVTGQSLGADRGEVPW